VTKQHLSIRKLPSNKQLIEPLNDEAKFNMPTQWHTQKVEFVPKLSELAKKKYIHLYVFHL